MSHLSSANVSPSDHFADLLERIARNRAAVSEHWVSGLRGTMEEERYIQALTANLEKYPEMVARMKEAGVYDFHRRTALAGALNGDFRRTPETSRVEFTQIVSLGEDKWQYVINVDFGASKD